MLVKSLCIVVFRIHEQTDTACHAEDFKELLHRRNQQDFTEAVAMVVFGDCQTPQPNSCYATGQFSRLNWWKCFRWDLAEVQCEEPENRFGLRGCFINENEGARDAPVCVLPCRLLEKDIECFDSTIEAVPIVDLCKRLNSMHAQSS